MSGHSRVRVSRAYEIISLRDGVKRWHMTKKVFAVRVDCCFSATTFIIGGSSHEKAEKVLVCSQFFEVVWGCWRRNKNPQATSRRHSRMM